jgi:CrcB protein
MNYVVVGIGGVLGSLARYSLGKYITEKSKSRFPIGTFIINITGAFLLGLVNSRISQASIYYSLLGDGFLGAYTTFSTFMYEGFKLFEDSKALNACCYIGLSIILGVWGYILGYML